MHRVRVPLGSSRTPQISTPRTQIGSGQFWAHYSSPKSKKLKTSLWALHWVYLFKYCIIVRFVAARRSAVWHLQRPRIRSGERGWGSWRGVLEGPDPQIVPESACRLSRYCLRDDSWWPCLGARRPHQPRPAPSGRLQRYRFVLNVVQFVITCITLS